MTVSPSVTDAVRSCLDWARETRPARRVDPRFLTRLLTVHGHVRSDPTDWDRDDVTRVVLTLSAGGPLPEDFRATWLTWCDHLVARELLGPEESPRALRAAVEEALPLPRDQVPWSGTADGAPWWGRLWEPEDLPRVHLAPAESSAPAARACPVLKGALRLTAWAGAGLPLAEGVEEETLTDHTVDEASAHLGLPRERVARLFEVALRAGFLRTTYTEVRPGAAARDRDDDAGIVLSWVRALPAMVAEHGTLGLRVLGELFTSGGVWTIPDLVEALHPWPAQAAPAPSVPAPRGSASSRDEPLPAPEDRVAAAVATLVHVGAVEPLPDAGLRITPLGDQGMAHRWRRWGISLPGYPPTAVMTARELLLQLWEGRPVDARVLGRTWLTERGVRTGARELLEVCAELAAWRQRLDVFRLLDGTDDGLCGVFEDYRDHPVLGGWIAHARNDPGRVRLEQLVVVMLDTYALRVELGAPLPADAQVWRDPETVTRLMWGSGHPAADGVLTAIALGALGPDAARAARRARFGTVGVGR
ncbi:hypothetical protein [Nocardiopsis sp. L17-MgMaSL7]|uniref:hypothetical protein n=1 Tax=Nocardiopsis sp. L17-MgMaSL7 TaxID=1938893 RepID=UPI000D71BCCA|nr:hypothetical protein [Nocardiopsis sp. L17-MgMaSL7]PWV44496.1 hypothetical protein BDW27_12435 [Nocardiopsis sp. L17-MgMaSL7]